MGELISVIVPVYNVQAYLSRCLQSIEKQTYQMIEIIIIDDGSTDESGKIADEFSSHEPRAYVIHKENGGLSDARNVGIDHSKGKYITFIDSDDYIAEDYIDYLYKLIKKYDVKIATSFYRMVSDVERVVDDIGGSNEDCITAEEAIQRMLYRNYISHNAWGKLFARDLFERTPTIDFSRYTLDEQKKLYIPVCQNRYRFPCGLINEDLALIYYLVIEAGKVAYGTKKTYYYVSNPASITKAKVKEKDFQVFDLYSIVGGIILGYYPNLSDAVLEFKETIYVKLYKRLVQNNQMEFNAQMEYIKNELRRTCVKALKSNVRKVTKIRVFVGAFSKKVFLLLCKMENLLGAKS